MVRVLYLCRLSNGGYMLYAWHIIAIVQTWYMWMVPDGRCICVIWLMMGVEQELNSRETSTLSACMCYRLVTLWHGDVFHIVFSVWEIHAETHRSQVESPHKGPVMWSVDMLEIFNTMAPMSNHCGGGIFTSRLKKACPSVIAFNKKYRSLPRPRWIDFRDHIVLNWDFPFCAIFSYIILLVLLVM